MNWVDFVILGIIGASFAWSFRHGLIMELVYFLSIALGLLLAFILYPFITPLLVGIFESYDYASTVAFGSVFLMGAGVVAISGILFHKFIHFINLGVFDRILGGVFGFVKAVLLVSVVLVMITALYGKERPEYLAESSLSQPIIEKTNYAMKTIPPLFNQFIQDYGEDALKWIRESPEDE